MLCWSLLFLQNVDTVFPVPYTLLSTTSLVTMGSSISFFYLVIVSLVTGCTMSFAASSNSRGVALIVVGSVAQWSRAGSFDLGSGFDPRRSHLIRSVLASLPNSGLNENLSRMAQEYRIVIQVVVPRLNVSKNIQELALKNQATE